MTNEIIAGVGALNFQDLSTKPIFQQPKNAVEEAVQEVIRDIWDTSSYQNSIGRNPKWTKSSINSDLLPIADIVKRILSKNGCKDVQLVNHIDIDFPYRHYIVFINPLYSSKNPVNHVEAILEKANKSIDFTIEYWMGDEPDLANSVGTLLKKQGCKNVKVECTGEHFGRVYQVDWHPSYFKISLTNPNHDVFVES